MIYQQPTIYKAPTVYKMGGGGGSDVILDDFVILKNGVYDSGLSPNYGNFGTVQEEENGFIENGKTPFFLRENFVDDSGYVSFFYDFLNDYFKDENEWTLDLWIKFEGNGLGAPGIFNVSQNRQTDYNYITLNNRTFSAYIQGSVRNDLRGNNFWHHIALVKYGAQNKRAYYYLDGIKIIGGDTTSSNPFDICNSIMIRKGSAPYDNLKIAQIAFRNRAVWKNQEQFFVPRKLYKQR